MFDVDDAVDEDYDNDDYDDGCFNFCCCDVMQLVVVVLNQSRGPSAAL